MKHQIRSLAHAMYKEAIPVKKIGILLKAEKLLSTYEYTTFSKFKTDFGFSYFAGINSSSKIIKGKKKDFNTLILYLSASKNAGVDICSHASTGCRLACLVESGHSRMDNFQKVPRVHISRMVKTWLTVYRRDIVEKVLSHEIKAGKKKFKNFVVRLNGTSDLDFYSIYAKFPKIQFYDYTKNPNRIPLDNYHLTFSFSQSNKARMAHYKQAIEREQAIAFAIRKDDFKRALQLPECFSMDDTDLRFLDIGKYGLLKVKLTGNEQSGVDNGFILSFDQLKEIINQIES
jgi:hypothetical protein